MIDLSTLNPQQLEAVKDISGPLMILAGAGTGKTRVITYRIAHMIQCGIDPEKIVAVTFTNKAAKEMKERAKELVGPKANKLKISTFHSFCLFILRKYAKKAGLDPNFNLVDTNEQIDLVQKALEEKNIAGIYKAADIHYRISHAKNNLVRPKDLFDDTICSPNFSDEDPSLLAATYHLYERQLKVNRVIDFDDCILKAYYLLKDCSEVSDKVRAQYSYFLVDEFQDTNFSQLQVLELLAKESRNICVVGDDDQSIYSWRGAMNENLEKFEQAFAPVKLIKLEQNYRCTNRILNAANTVIKHNTGRKEKTLWSNSDSDIPISLKPCLNDSEEARWIAEKCLSLLGQGLKYSDIGILYRANNQAKSIEMALRETNLRYKVFGGTSLFERKEIKDFLSYFKLSLNLQDRLSFFRIINTPTRGFGIKTLEKIEEKAISESLSPFSVLTNDLIPFKGNMQKNADHFINSMKEIHDIPLSEPSHLVEKGRKIIELFKLDDDIRQKAPNEKAKHAKLELLKGMPKWLGQLGETLMEEHGELNKTLIFDTLSLSGKEKGTEDSDKGDYISLMTIHGSKGLEFPAVFLCGVEEEIIPHKNSTSQQAIAEERRLFYVALTRAKKRLHLSYAMERQSRYQSQDRKPSRFIKEMPKDGVNFESSHMNPAATEETKKTRNLKRFAGLKEKLSKGFN